MRSIGTGKMPGSDAPFRRELEASVPATLNSVLVFYRSELGKRGWQETVEGAVVKPDQVQLAFTAPDGPATLKLGRSKGETNNASTTTGKNLRRACPLLDGGRVKLTPMQLQYG